MLDLVGVAGVEYEEVASPAVRDHAGFSCGRKRGAVALLKASDTASVNRMAFSDATTLLSRCWPRTHTMRRPHLNEANAMQEAAMDEDCCGTGTQIAAEMLTGLGENLASSKWMII